MTLLRNREIRKVKGISELNNQRICDFFTSKGQLVSLEIKIERHLNKLIG